MRSGAKPLPCTSFLTRASRVELSEHRLAQAGSFRASPLIDPGVESLAYKVTTRDGWVEYAAASDPAHPVWEMRCEGDTLEMRSLYRPGGAAHDLTWKFDPHVTHATLLDT